jgi:hypothetical protein
VPLPPEAAPKLVAGARRLLVKAGREILSFDEAHPITAAEIDAYLVHADGFVNVPVLVMGDLLVRGYTDELYRRALGEASP